MKSQTFDQEAQRIKELEHQIERLLTMLKEDEYLQSSKQIESKYLQELLTNLIKLYVCRIQTEEDREMVSPVLTRDINATETAIFVDKLLESMNIELFEVQIWRSIGSTY